jgi:hypothetical protein
MEPIGFIYSQYPFHLALNLQTGPALCFQKLILCAQAAQLSRLSSVLALVSSAIRYRDLQNEGHHLLGCAWSSRCILRSNRKYHPHS